MRITAEFQISNGDEIILYGMKTNYPHANWSVPGILDQIIEDMAVHMITGVMVDWQRNNLGDPADPLNRRYLVTHPEDSTK